MRAGVLGGLERIGVPVTLAWPQHDRLIPRPAHLPPNVRNVTLAGCGHMPMWDDPAQVTAMLVAASAGQPVEVLPRGATLNGSRAIIKWAQVR